ncbi:MAG: tetratricopeptide repeat protein [Sandaracinaceae bacterium]
MSVDRTKVLEAAQKHLSKGNYDKAIAEYRKIVQSDPTDVRTWLKIGDLYTRKGSRSEAVETYARVAAQYGDQGFFSKGLAVYKQILKLDPTRLDIQIKLAEMYESLDLLGDALGTYEHVAAAYARAGDIERAIATLQKMTALDPQNIPVRIKCAEALSKAGKTQEAAAEFESGAGLLKAQGRIDDYIKVAERLLYHRPEDVSIARELSELYLQRSDPKRALSKLQLCFKADPKDIPTLELLAGAFNQLGQLPKTISVYKEVARIHQEAGRDDARARTLQKILELDPGDREARQALAGYAAEDKKPIRRDIQPPPSAVVSPGSREEPILEAVPDDVDDLEDLDELDDEVVEVYEVDSAEQEVMVVEPEDEADDIDIAISSAPPAPIEDVPAIAASSLADASSLAAAQPAPLSQPSVPPDVQREAQIARLLTECDVFMRYGLKAKVVEQLQAVLEIEPLHVEAHERLKDLYLGDNRIDEAVGELLALSDILSTGESAAAKLYLRQVLELDPTNIDALTRLEGMPSIPPPGAPPTTDEPLEPDADADAVFFLDEAADGPTQHEGPIEARASEPILSPPPSFDDAPLDADPLDADPLEPEPAEASPALSRPAIPPPSRPGVVVPPPAGKPRMDMLAPMSPEEFDHVPLRPSTPGQVLAETSQRLSMPPGEVEEILEEAEFFVAQGLMEEAHASLREALNVFPNHPLILEKLGEVRTISQHQQLAASRSSAEIDLDQSFELAEKLAVEFGEIEDTQAGSDVLDVEAVFAQFKAGVEAQVGVEDTETHFDLGIAYKEMGLLDDAINEFALCLANPQRLCIAETMIGLCHIEKGQLAEAINHFKKGLYADRKTDREELGLYFELGRAYELLGDTGEALYYYQKVQKRDGTFRDVAGRIAAVGAPRVDPSSQSVAMARDDIDRAFDDLMGED